MKIKNRGLREKILEYRISLLILLILGFILAVGVFHSPVIIYYAGKWKASHSGPGEVAGLTILKLPVTYHRQEHALSCEIAALKMALGSQGVDVSETELINKIAVDPTPRQKNLWGDPNLGFVGDIDGKMMGNGYGVYAAPIAELAKKYRYSEVLQQPTEGDLIAHIEAGRPVIVWGYFGQGKIISWMTPAGKRIDGVNGEHARILSGYIGSGDTITNYILLDPIYGELYWSKEEFLKNWNALNRMAVVVYGSLRINGQE